MVITDENGRCKLPTQVLKCPLSQETVWIGSNVTVRQPASSLS